MEEIYRYFGLQPDNTRVKIGESNKLAAAVVLLAAASADNTIDPVEREMVIRLVKSECSVPDEAISRILANAHENLPVLDGFIDQLHSYLNPEQREHLLALVFKIIAADNRVAPGESEFAVRLRVKLGLTMEQSIRARKLAEDSAGPDGFKELVEAWQARFKKYGKQT
jgi:uncharacterized tellurite resistance protein B-like protein